MSLTTSLVPSKGLEPPHRCRYMDLNHARLPIPPRWQVDFSRSEQNVAASGRPAVPILQARKQVSNEDAPPTTLEPKQPPRVTAANLVAVRFTNRSTIEPVVSQPHILKGIVDGI